MAHTSRIAASLQPHCVVKHHTCLPPGWARQDSSRQLYRCVLLQCPCCNHPELGHNGQVSCLSLSLPAPAGCKPCQLQQTWQTCPWSQKGWGSLASPQAACVLRCGTWRSSRARVSSRSCRRRRHKCSSCSSSSTPPSSKCSRNKRWAGAQHALLVRIQTMHHSSTRK